MVHPVYLNKGMFLFDLVHTLCAFSCCSHKAFKVNLKILNPPPLGCPSTGTLVSYWLKSWLYLVLCTCSKQYSPFIVSLLICPGCHCFINKEGSFLLTLLFRRRLLRKGALALRVQSGLYLRLHLGFQNRR